MDYYVNRAMMIACLNPDQFLALHAKERAIGRLLAPFEAQRIFGLATIKETFSIPEDEAAQVQHAVRIRTELLGKKIAEDVHLTDSNGRIEKTLKPWEAITEAAPERVHNFDNRVQAAAEEGAIHFAYEGGVAGGSKLRERARASRVLA